jgi:hypothetical protein
MSNLLKNKYGMKYEEPYYLIINQSLILEGAYIGVFNKLDLGSGYLKQ